MSAGNAFSEPRGSESGGTMRVACPLHGCKRVYSDRSALDTHIKEHDSPAQSIPGKVLLCSTVGCSSSFPNMKRLMEHMRQHHKPNIYFLCESCRTKLRSYRGLLTHLHTCSKVSRGKPKVTDALSPSANTSGGSSNPNPAAHQNPPQLESMSKSQEMSFQTSGSGGSVPQPTGAAAPPHLHTAVPSLDVQPEQQELKKTVADLPPHVGPGAAADPPDIQAQPQAPTRGPALTPRPPAAVGQKNPGSSPGGRVLWEHSKGRYVCVQCGHVVSNRTEMMQHMDTHNRAAEDAGNSAANAPSAR